MRSCRQVELQVLAPLQGLVSQHRFSLRLQIAQSRYCLVAYFFRNDISKRQSKQQTQNEVSEIRGTSLGFFRKGNLDLEP